MPGVSRGASVIMLYPLYWLVCTALLSLHNILNEQPKTYEYYKSNIHTFTLVYLVSFSWENKNYFILDKGVKDSKIKCELSVHWSYRIWSLLSRHKRSILENTNKENLSSQLRHRIQKQLQQFSKCHLVIRTP